MWKSKKKKKYKNRKVYVHFGSNKFDSSIKGKENEIGSKPHGLWSSPKYCNLSWKNWCECNDFHTEKLEKFFEFKLKKNAKILKIKSLKDIEQYLVKPEKQDLSFSFWQDYGYKIDLEYLYNNFDGMEVFISQNYCEFHNSYIFYPWDVDSIVVWNYNVIDIIKRKEKQIL